MENISEEKIVKAFNDTIKRNLNYKDFIFYAKDFRIYVSHYVFSILYKFNIIIQNTGYNRNNTGILGKTKNSTVLVCTTTDIFIPNNIIKLSFANVLLLTDEEYIIKEIIE